MFLKYMQLWVPDYLIPTITVSTMTIVPQSYQGKTSGTNLLDQIQYTEGGHSRGTMRCHLKREESIFCNDWAPDKGLGGTSKRSRDRVWLGCYF